jgi:hypothetical protein
MIVLGREVYVCKCSTDVPREPSASGVLPSVEWTLGNRDHFAKVPREHHEDAHFADFEERLRRGEQWLIGIVEGKIVSYTWLHARSHVSYPYLPGCRFKLGPGVGYGYDAWTLPDLRGEGLRRRGFVEELRVLRTSFGCEWEASFFVKHQLEGATRSLAKAGIEIMPLWRVRLAEDRKVAFESLAPHDRSAEPMEPA